MCGRASQTWQVSLHGNKGLAGAPADAQRWTADTATNPGVLNSFALAIDASNEPPAYPGIPGHEPDVTLGRQEAELVAAAMAPLRALRAPRSRHGALEHRRFCQAPLTKAD
jgi:hypothetical protein